MPLPRLVSKIESDDAINLALARRMLSPALCQPLFQELDLYIVNIHDIAPLLDNVGFLFSSIALNLGPLAAERVVSCASQRRQTCDHAQGYGKLCEAQIDERQHSPLPSFLRLAFSFGD